jgi:hypothetical protein
MRKIRQSEYLAYTQNGELVMNHIKIDLLPNKIYEFKKYLGKFYEYHPSNLLSVIVIVLMQKKISKYI